ncbi:MAG: CRTAC1 family protein [Paracoccaceae bacterium]
MRISIPVLVLLLAAGPAVAGARPAFEERGRALGVTQQYTGGWEHFVGGGVATFDCDGDLMPELFVAGGETPAALLRNSGQRGGEVKFREDTPDTLRLSGVTGAYPLDIDGDGRLDLAVLRAGTNMLFKGGAGCSFAEFPDSLGFRSTKKWTTAFSATWEAGNALPTLAFGNYVDRDDPDGPFGACDASMLYRPDGGAYADPLPLEPGYCALSMLFSDWGRKGRQDLRVSNDRHYYVKDGSEQMWAMEAAPRLYTAADGWAEQMIWGMGIASRDISGDGVPEVFLTSMGDQKLQHLEDGADGPRFADARFVRGTTAHRPYEGDDGRPSTGWHAQFGDVQNDGLDDIFIAKGNVDQMPSSAMKDPNNLLIQQDDGRFSEAGAEADIDSAARGRGAALEDLNLDGLLDLVVVNRRAPLEIYENITEGAGNWLLLDVSQPAPNPDAVGAWIEVRASGRTWSREITVGGGHASGAATVIHFGLGGAGRAELRVIWPDGAASAWREVGTNRVLRVSRGGDGLEISPL